MSSIRTALVRLNVVPQKIGFWEVRLANSIKRAEFLDDFDAKQVSKEKQVARSELSNFERAVRAGTQASVLQQRFAKLSKPTIDILNSQISMIAVSPTDQRGKSNVVLRDTLASTLVHAHDTVQSGVVSPGVERVLLVAGAGFTQLPTLREKV